MTPLQRAVWAGFGLAGFGLVLSACAGLAAAQALPDAVPDLPRAYGYSVGDVVQRRVQLQLPPGWSLDLDALPRSRRPGQALELRNAHLDGELLLLDYQVFLAPTEVRTLEMPPLMLRFVGPERVQGGQGALGVPGVPGAEGAARGLRDIREVRVDAWPLTVAPLVPVEVSPREGLGAMRPDMPAAPIDTTPRQHRLLVLAALLLAVGAALAHLHLGLPWWGRRQRPFAQTWRQLRRWPERAHPEQARAAMKLMHAALNRSAGQVLFAGGVAAFVDRQPRFKPLQPVLCEFFERSQATFFTTPAVTGAAMDAMMDPEMDPEMDPDMDPVMGTDMDPATGATDIGWLKRLCRDCLDAERGAR